MRGSPIPRACCTKLLRLTEDADGRWRAEYASGGTYDAGKEAIHDMRAFWAGRADGDQLCEIVDGYWRGYALLPRDPRRKIRLYRWMHHMHPPVR